MWDTEPVVEMLRDEGASLVLEYGSSVRDRRRANDVDLFALYEDGADRTENVRLGNFEIIRLTKGQLRSYRRVLDPVYCVEPVLKGEIRHGDVPTLDALRADLSNRRPTGAAVRHNLYRSRSEYLKATEFLDAGEVKKGIETLSFVASHRLFAEWYTAENTPETLETVRSKLSTELPTAEIFEALERHKGGASVTEGRLETLLRSWEQATLESDTSSEDDNDWKKNVHDDPKA